MRAISLWQPWASAIARGSKTIETRHWPTKYRGPLAIHAAKRCVLRELIHFDSCSNFRGALGRAPEDKPLRESLPFGALIATVELVDCRPSETFMAEELDAFRVPDFGNGYLYGWTERDLGDFSPGRYGWTLANVRALDEPIKFRGRQGFFHVPDELLGLMGKP